MKDGIGTWIAPAPVPSVFLALITTPSSVRSIDIRHSMGAILDSGQHIETAPLL